MQEHVIQEQDPIVVEPMLDLRGCMKLRTATPADLELLSRGSASGSSSAGASDRDDCFLYRLARAGYSGRGT
jgi:hypothetical protein